MADSTFTFKQNNYFPTMVFVIDIKDPVAMNKELLAAIYADRERDPKGHTKSNVEELGGWHSKTGLHRQKSYSKLVRKINSATRRMSTKLGYAEDHEIRIGSMWSIVNPRGSLNIAHVHPGCLWSGVYYVQTPKNSGNIEFIEPRTVHLMNQPQFKPKTKRQKDCWTKVNFTPNAGKMIIFPAWLYHSVRPNVTDTTGDEANRVIISFNLNQRKISKK